MKSVSDIIKLLGHENRVIDIFKIDCEGCEWLSYMDWYKIPNIRRIQIELRYVGEAEKLLPRLREHGFVIFHKEFNTIGCDGRCIEYALLRLSKRFFE